MSSWLTFVIGVMLGLLAGWLIDLLYRRRAPTTSGGAELPPAPEPLLAPEAAAAAAAVVSEEQAPAEVSQEADWPVMAERVAEVVNEPETTPPMEPHISDELPTAPEALPPEAVEALAPAVVAAGSAARDTGPVDARDKLVIIEGIGPAYEAKLRAAGIDTFRQLADTDPERLREIIQPQSWQRVNFTEWIEQARLAAEGEDEELKALQARLFGRKK